MNFNHFHMNKTTVSLLTALLLMACAQQPQKTAWQGFSKATPTGVPLIIEDQAIVDKPAPASADQVIVDQPVAALGDPKETTAKTASGSLWERLCNHLGLGTVQHPRIDAQIDQLSRDPYHLLQLSERAQPFLHYIFERTQARELPAELVFLPMVESAFEPTATSPGQAGGLWQIRPATAEYLGLDQNQWYDGRYDLRAATRAALNYLEHLRDRFDGDWLLAMAAYNAGPGRVIDAIRRNKQAGKPTDYWHLDLPPITLNYVPKILALSRLAADPNAHGIELQDIEDAPYFVNIDIGYSIDLSAAATAAGINEEEIRNLNACFTHGVTPPRTTSSLLVPRQQASILQSKLKRLAANTRSQGDKNQRNYIVRRGDTLWTIARRHGIPHRQLARWNGLRVNGVLRPGQKLVIRGTL